MTKAKSKSTRGKGKSKFAVIIFGILVVIIMAYVGFSIAGFKSHQPEMKDIDEVDQDERIKIEVFNGCYDSKKTLQISDMIRQNANIDVIDIIKSPGSFYPRTMILDRKGDTEKMKQLAGMLGLSDENIIMQRSNQYIDATLVVGIDHEELWKSLENLSK